MASNRWVAVVVALGMLLVGALAYDVGLARGAAHAAEVAGSAGATVQPYMYGWGWHRPWGFGFPVFFFVFVWLVLLRGLFWGGPWRRRWYYGDPYRFTDGFEKWHRRAHERMKDEPTAPRT